MTDNTRCGHGRGRQGEGSHTTYDLGEYDRPTVGVVEAVAAATDRDPGSLPQLGHVVDPDAIDDLLASGPDVEIDFEYADTTVTVRGDATVVVDVHC
ncbi:HalOD1 output domain-containing protein [Halobacterium rubrum]|uniref:HalOD1 output domain-containing protein n=1 Tax=Halobacterium TaxID=2239 RepID=UPI001F465CAA|nr:MULTISPECIES: HalOD1 output domain-containing protein [Halobacterium]MDH5018642.1 hypothetical protein [Halobacterium rubrum]